MRARPIVAYRHYVARSAVEPRALGSAGRNRTLGLPVNSRPLVPTQATAEWLKGGDSNPCDLSVASLAVTCNRPLCHPSVSGRTGIRTQVTFRSTRFPDGGTRPLCDPTKSGEREPRSPEPFRAAVVRARFLSQPDSLQVRFSYAPRSTGLGCIGARKDSAPSPRGRVWLSKHQRQRARSG